MKRGWLDVCGRPDVGGFPRLRAEDDIADRTADSLAGENPIEEGDVIGKLLLDAWRRRREWSDGKRIRIETAPVRGGADDDLHGSVGRHRPAGQRTERR